MMKYVQQQRNLLWTIAMLMMFLDMPVVNSLASNTLMNNHLIQQHHHRHHHHQQQQYRRHHYCEDNTNNWTSLSLPYTIGSTIVKDKIPDRPQDLSYSLEDVLVTDVNPIICTLVTLMTVTTNTWRKMKSAMKFDKQAFAKLGIGFGLTYSFISNINGSITLSVAWYIASIKTGLSPCATGQWKNLVAAYASMYIFVFLLRPLRVTLALGMTYRMERLLQCMQKRRGYTRQKAIIVTSILGIVLWGSCCAIGVTLASAFSGVPLWRTSTM
mmetsp:Transcript_19602/g.21910  ORF Transcript_19602/g.21910 Transcript_19602/m.21910 type:complete len:270 (-) Transcript_19602:77-886(-)